MIFCPVRRLILSPVLYRDIWFLTDGEENKLHVSENKVHRTVFEHTHRYGQCQYNAVGIVTSYRVAFGGFGFLLLQKTEESPPSVQPETRFTHSPMRCVQEGKAVGM
jgi:hypothetical protein